MSALFGDQSLNHLVKELWHLAMHSERVKSRLTKMYQRVFDGLPLHFVSTAKSTHQKLTEADVFGVFSLGLGMTVMADFYPPPSSVSEFAFKAIGQRSSQATNSNIKGLKKYD